MAPETQQEMREVVFMYDPQPRYVSLVKRGANQIPFRIVKNVKEDQVKVIQSIVATKGTEVEAIKTALGQDVATIVKLEMPVESAGFVTFEQMPREAFKSDTFQVVALNEEKTVLGIQGELAEKAEGGGIIAKIFKPAEKTQVISVPEGTPTVDQAVLKSQLSSLLWEEMDALWQAIHGILSQEEGDGATKVSMVKKIMDNFTASLETAMVAMKCDRLDVPVKEPGKTADETPVEKSGTPKENPAQGEDLPAEQAAGSQLAPAVDLDVLSEQAAQKAAEALKPQIDEALKPLAETVASLSQEIAKMQKIPAAVVADRTDDGVVAARKNQSSESVFKGVFGNLR